MALHGEIGMSLMKSTDITNKLKMRNHLKNTRRNSLLKMVEEIRSMWLCRWRSICMTVGTCYEILSRMKEEKINLKVNQWEERRW